MYTAALKAVLNRLHSRVIDLPWVGPNGETWQAMIYSHDRPEYQAALAKSGVVPKGIEERQRATEASLIAAMIRAQKDGETETDEAERKDEERREIVELGFPLNLYPVAYTKEEVRAVLPLVAEHLVEWVAVKMPDGEPQKLAPQDVAGWFSSKEILPRVVPVFEAGSDRPEPVRIVMGGIEEGIALGAAVLRESVKEHEFQERIVPLSSRSASGGGTRATTKQKRGYKPPSPPASPNDSGAVLKPTEPAAT